MTLFQHLDKIGQRAYSSRFTLKQSYDLAHAAAMRDPSAIMVECGVAAGANAAAMALGVMMARGPMSKRVHLFDSFTGVPVAGEHDTEWTHPPGAVASTMEEVSANMHEWGIEPGLLVYHAGLFQDTVPKWAAAKPKIAVLRLDGDLYESTKVCLEHLVPLVTPGGWVIVDDFDLSGCRKAALDYMGSGFGPVYFQRH